MFPTMFFDRDRCIDGLNFLRRYRFEATSNSMVPRVGPCMTKRLLCGRRSEVYGCRNDRAVYGELPFAGAAELAERSLRHRSMSR